MDPTNGKASEFERRASMRASVRLSVAGDDEDYDLGAMTIADGFRPTDTSARRLSDIGSSSTLSSSTLQVPDGPSIQRTAASRPSSIAKPPRSHSDSISSRNDVAAGPTTGSPLSRVSSVSTESPMVRLESPYSGPSGPSHPYMMYPQRTLSVATASTAPVSEGSYHGPRDPTHPYGLYNQNTAPTDGSNGEAIPVGFLGVSDGYARRIGPDGEEVGDLIGPLGHTEELPPYTRYPDEAYARKAAPEPQPVPIAAGATVVPSEATSPQVIPGAGGIGLATRDPEYASINGLDSPRSRLSTRSFTSDTSQHEINTAARAITEKQSSSKWQERAKKKMWGIVPYWAICLLAVALVLMGIILGSVIGTFLAKHKRLPARPDAQPDHLPTATMDVTPLPTMPADLPALDTGVFGLPPLIASQAPNTCFNATTQAQAWSCNIPFTVYFMEIAKIPDQPSTSQYALKLTTPSSNGSLFTRYAWGTQPPLIPEAMRLILVNDTSEPGRGPAWWMQMTYNKTVILAEDKFPGQVGTATPVSKRFGKTDFKNNDFKRKGLAGAQTGDKPWICTWPGTILEAFIYPAQNNSFKPFPTTPSSSSATNSYTSGAPTMTPSPSPSSNPSNGPGPGSGPNNGGDGSPNNWHPNNQPPTPPAYPKVIKFEERRFPGSGSTMASCRQVEILDDGQDFRPVIDVDGTPVEVSIVENHDNHRPPTPETSYNSRRWVHGNDLFYRDLPSDLSDCGCIWWFT